jgi:hypothetical protein
MPHATIDPRISVQAERSPLRTAVPRVLAIATLLALVATTGCLTPRVRKLVEDSNTAIVSATLLRDTPSVDPQGSPSDTPEATLAAIESIEDFIEQNPDRKRMVASLRVRQAILYLTVGQRNGAKAAFALVESEDDLASERDRTLYRIREALVWWYGAAPRPGWAAADIAQATQALDDLAKAADAIPAGDDGRPASIRFLVEQMRVRIALRAARASSDSTYVEERVSDDAVRYANQFDTTDQHQILKLCQSQDITDPRLGMFRWYAYTATAFDEARARWADATSGETPPPASPMPAWTDPISRAGCPGFP